MRSSSIAVLHKIEIFMDLAFIMKSTSQWAVCYPRLVCIYSPKIALLLLSISLIRGIIRMLASRMDSAPNIDKLRNMERSVSCYLQSNRREPSWELGIFYTRRVIVWLTALVSVLEQVYCSIERSALRKRERSLWERWICHAIFFENWICWPVEECRCQNWGGLGVEKANSWSLTLMILTQKVQLLYHSWFVFLFFCFGINLHALLSQGCFVAVSESRALPTRNSEFR